MHLLLVGLNHETASLEVRERVAFSSKATLAALQTLKGEGHVSEVALLATCNRTELYALLPTDDPAPLQQFLESVAKADLTPHLYIFEGNVAARHLMRVACGLNSMILGEGQILSQVKTALQQATEAGSLGGRLSSLFRHALTAGKRARTETNIARGAVSISNATVHLARNLFGDLTNKSALVLGAGETAELTLRLLTDAGVRSVMVANRTYDHALALAESMGGRAAHLNQLVEVMSGADIVISSTAAPHAVIRRDQVQAVMRKRRGRPLFLIDIAVPRDIEPSVGDLEDVFLYNIDELQRVVDQNLGERMAETQQVEAIVEEELQRFLSAWHSLSLGPMLNALQEKLEEIRVAEMEKSGRRLTGLSEAEREAVELLTRGIVKRILKDPIATMKSRGDSPEGALYVDVVRELFGLPESAEGPVLPTPELETLETDEIPSDRDLPKERPVSEEAARRGCP